MEHVARKLFTYCLFLSTTYRIFVLPEDDVNCRDLCEVILFYSEVSYGEVLVDKVAMYIRVILYCGHLIVL